ncbi:MAG: hypothetical protein Q9196_002715, partial [Gyalolechia fulgens]
MVEDVVEDVVEGGVLVKWEEAAEKCKEEEGVGAGDDWESFFDSDTQVEQEISRQQETPSAAPWPIPLPTRHDLVNPDPPCPHPPLPTVDMVPESPVLPIVTLDLLLA